LNVSRKGFLAGLLGLIAAPFVKFLPEKEESEWVHICPVCFTECGDLKLVERSDWVAGQGWQAVGYQHGDRICLVPDHTNPDYYTITSSPTNVPIST
jgi:hypothetical protein